MHFWTKKFLGKEFAREKELPILFLASSFSCLLTAGETISKSSCVLGKCHLDRPSQYPIHFNGRTTLCCSLADIKKGSGISQNIISLIIRSTGSSWQTNLSTRGLEVFTTCGMGQRASPSSICYAVAYGCWCRGINIKKLKTRNKQTKKTNRKRKYKWTNIRTTLCIKLLRIVLLSISMIAKYTNCLDGLAVFRHLYTFAS